jgi:hypothetical protein
MPGELQDPVCMFPFHYESLYEPGTGAFDPSIDTLSSVVCEITGLKLNPEKINELKNHLESKGLFFRNNGDESFRNEIKNYIKKLKMARKVLNKCLI